MNNVHVQFQVLTKNLFILLAGWRTTFGAVSAAVATPFWWGGIYRGESFHLVVRKQVSPSSALMGETSNHRGGNRMRLTHSCLNRRCQRLAFSAHDDSAKRKASLVRKQVSTLMITDTSSHRAGNRMRPFCTKESRKKRIFLNSLLNKSFLVRSWLELLL